MKEKILVLNVDDEEFNREIIHKFLTLKDMKL